MVLVRYRYSEVLCLSTKCANPSFAQNRRSWWILVVTWLLCPWSERRHRHNHDILCTYCSHIQRRYSRLQHRRELKRGYSPGGRQMWSNGSETSWPSTQTHGLTDSWCSSSMEILYQIDKKRRCTSTAQCFPYFTPVYRIESCLYVDKRNI